MSDYPVTVLVLAVGGNVSQGILKSLSMASAPCRILGADVSPLQMGLFTVDKAFVSPWANVPDFLPWLIRVCQEESVDAILSGCEPVLLELARHRDLIEQQSGARCLVSDWETLEIGDDKLKTCEWLSAQCLPHPAYADAADSHAVARLAQDVGFPLIGKPRRGGGSRGLLVLENDDDLAYACRKPGYMLQALVGTEDEEYTVGCFLDREGLLAPSCCMRRELLAGTTYRAVLGDFPEIRGVSEAITAALKPRGPCNIQLRMTPDGPVCFEINPRLSGSAPIRAHYGYNEASAMLENFVLGRPVNLPWVTSGTAIRYWNELYPDPAAVEALETTGRMSVARGTAGSIESYGLKSG